MVPVLARGSGAGARERPAPSRFDAHSTAAFEQGILGRRKEIGLSQEPESLVLELLRNIRADVARVDGKVEMAKADMRSLRADIAADFVAVNAGIDSVRKDTGEQIAGLRRAAIEYHSAVLGHGMLISELEARMRRVEQHLNLPAIDAH
jgi:hypothetical protein